MSGRPPGGGRPAWPAVLAVAAIEIVLIAIGVALVPSDAGDLVVIAVVALAGGEAIRRLPRRGRAGGRRPAG